MTVSSRLTGIVFVLSTHAGCIQSIDKPDASIEGTTQSPTAQAEAQSRPAKVAEWNWLELEGPLVGYIEMVAFSPDGSLVAAGAGDTICVWASASGKLVTRMRLPENQARHRLCFTSDGKTLVSDGSEDPMIRFWDVRTGRQNRELPHVKPAAPGGRFYSGFQGFGPGASIIVFATYDDGTWAFKLMHLADGKVNGLLKMPLAEFSNCCSVELSPDGKYIALNKPDSWLRLFDTKTTKLVRELRPGSQERRIVTGPGSLRFSLDGKYLIAREDTGRSDQYTSPVYRHVIWGIEDGRRYWSTEKRGGWIPVGNRYVIADSKSAIDLLTDQDVPLKNPLTMTDARLAGMSRDGKTIAFVGDKSDRAPDVATKSVYLSPAPILVEPSHHADRDLSAEELNTAWSGAVSENVFRRNHFSKTLAAHPGQAIRIAESKLKPVSKAESDRVAELIKRLDDDDPDVRDKASTEIERLAHRFEPILSAALKSSGPGEVRNRLTAIINKMAISDLPQELNAELAGIGFLEEFGTSEARRVLERLAKGEAGSRSTEAATMALKRLEKSPK